MIASFNICPSSDLYSLLAFGTVTHSPSGLICCLVPYFSQNSLPGPWALSYASLSNSISTTTFVIAYLLPCLPNLTNQQYTPFLPESQPLIFPTIPDNPMLSPVYPR